MISPADYLTIANTLSGGFDDITNAVLELNAVNMTLQQIVGADPTAQSNVSSSISQCVGLLEQLPSSQIITATSSLQKHVSVNAGSVNSFLANNGIKVTQTFANLSSSVGYVIDSSNISS